MNTRGTYGIKGLFTTIMMWLNPIFAEEVNYIID
jgi:hypothetical protein